MRELDKNGDHGEQDEQRTVRAQVTETEALTETELSTGTQRTHKEKGACQ